jgi:hypothetical protein
MLARNRVIAGVLVCVFSAIAYAADTSGWRIDKKNRQITVRPAGPWKHEDVAIIVRCVSDAPQFIIQTRDPVALNPEVTLQFGGTSGRAIVFVGRNGVIRSFKHFIRGSNARFAVADPSESHSILAELLRGHRRLAWMVDTEDDGLDSLEVQTAGFEVAWHTIRCGRR